MLSQAEAMVSLLRDPAFPWQDTLVATEHPVSSETSGNSPNTT